ncbi:hypothetical protein QFC21_006529 [Naganishia friedmannii]|uniref:Uncharacterized protein n=1 Tax=Naganishia friedmannii TaxID=89922 RepID=A0ACC2V3R5_9TREE|nr:hypothetical protein QFC21_006529 [Naganishia friedmannii]
MDILNRPHFSRTTTSHSITPSTSSPDDQYMRILADEAYARRYPSTPSGRSVAGSSYRTFGISGSGGSGGGLTEEQYRILGEFQRVVYGAGGGRSLLVDDDEREEREDDMDRVDAAQKKEQLRLFLEQHFEADCVYESPLITLHSRPLIMDAITLSSDLNSSRLPSIYPRALLQHSGTIARWGLRKLFGSQSAVPGEKGKDVESAQSKVELYAGGRVEQIVRALVPWLVNDPAAGGSRNAEGAEAEGWWEVWHVSSECTELGGFETWHGCHTGIIDHTITLKLLPSLLGMAAEPSQATTPDDGYPFTQYQSVVGASAFTSPAPSTSYLPSHYATHSHPHPHPHPLLRLRTRTRPVPVPAPQNSSTLLPVAAIQKALATLLTFQLRVRTFVEFNEQGRVGYVRDLVDVRDVWEAVVPFGRGAGWVGRRVCGVLVAGLGRVFGPSPSDGERPSWEREREREKDRKGKEKDGAGLHSHQLALQDAAAPLVLPEGKVPVPTACVPEASNTMYPGVPLKIQQLSALPAVAQQPAQQPQLHALPNVLGLQEAWSSSLPRPTFHPTSAALVQAQTQMTTSHDAYFAAPDVDRGAETSEH